MMGALFGQGTGSINRSFLTTNLSALSYQDALLNLSDPDPAVRREALKAVSENPPQGDHRKATSAVSSCLVDPDESVRDAAVDGLCNMAVQQLDSGAEGRRLAVDALAVLALKHDERAIAAISTCLQDQNGEVRNQAMNTLVKVGTNKTEGFEDIIEATL